MYTYGIPAEIENVQPGNLVLVQFGNRKIYTALVFSIQQEKPDYAVKPILALEEEHPVVTLHQLKFWQWLSNYYMCSMGEVFNASLPAAYRLQSESVLVNNHLMEIEWEVLNDREFLLMEALQSQVSLKLSDAAKIVELKNPMPVIRGLMQKQLILLEEEVRDKVKPKMVKYTTLHASIQEKDVEGVFKSLKSAPKQIDLLLAYFKLKAQTKKEQVLEKDLLETAGASLASLKGLYQKNIFTLIEIQTGGIALSNETLQPKQLSKNQAKAYQNIKDGFEANKTVLLHGVTSSGKTEIYIKLIAEALDENKNALYLLPEIALTTQLITRLKHHFKERLLVYHSKQSNRERLDVWNTILNAGNKSFVVIGARSAVFLPFTHLGLVIVDEEHETAYKQSDPAPRYNGRDAALMLSNIHKSAAILGSATPSMESYLNAQGGKYTLVELLERFGGVQLPLMEVVDIKKEHKDRTMQSHFSTVLIEAIQETVAAKQKVILFQNRRGFAPVLHCNTCGHSPQCKHCDITLTYHKYSNQLRCHYCGYSVAPQHRCKACGSSDLKYMGFGTEKVEEELKTLLPELRIARMDLDNTRKKNAFQNLINDFEEGKIDVLVGTQMVAKGLDFDDVLLVGILNADSMLNFPDFRAHERAFQLMAQVSGRAGRRENRGKVLIQTFDPYHQVIKQVVENDFKALVKDQAYERKQFGYPPFVRLIQLTLRHRDQTVLSKGALQLATLLRLKLGNAVLGPEFPAVARLKGQYQKQILIKMDQKLIKQKVKSFILDQADRVLLQKEFARIRIIYDVDPS